MTALKMRIPALIKYDKASDCNQRSRNTLKRERNKARQSNKYNMFPLLLFLLYAQVFSLVMNI